MKTIINSVDFNVLKNSQIWQRALFFREKLMNEVDPVYYTANAISKRTGIPAQTITSIERGESKKPSFHVIHTLAKEFNIPMEAFTDEYYEGDEKLFSLGKSSFETRETEGFETTAIEVEDGDSILTNGSEYVLRNNSLIRKRNITVYVVEELHDGRDKRLYHHEISLKEDALLLMLSQIIQAVELNPMTLSSPEWKKALERSPLKLANNIINHDVTEFTTININYDLEDSLNIKLY